MQWLNLQLSLLLYIIIACISLKFNHLKDTVISLMGKLKYIIDEFS